MSPRRLVLALALTTAAAWRFPGLARPREEDVIEHEVTPTGPRELTIETHDYEAHESTMVLPFEDTHACLLQSLKDYLDTHGEEFESKIMLKIGGHRVDSNSADYFRMMPDGVISKTLIHLMERPPGRTSRHIERIIGSQKTLRLQDLLILATDTESLHPDIDTDIVLSTDFAEIHPWLVVWHGNEIPVLQYLHDHNYVCYKEGHEHWCVGGQRAIAAGLTEFCGCQHIYAGCQAFPADPAATPPPTDED